MNILFLMLFTNQATAQWERDRIAYPIVSAQAFVSSSGNVYTSSILGGVLGMRYHKFDADIPLHGRTRGIYTRTFFSSVQSSQLTVGSFWGPKLGPVLLEAGGDVMINSDSIPNVYDGQYASMALPIRALIDVKGLYFHTEVAPIFFLADLAGEARRSANIGGSIDEFYYMINAGIKQRGVKIGVNFQRRTSAYGSYNTIGAQFGR